jgi:hypothetical protein
MLRVKIQFNNNNHNNNNMPLLLYYITKSVFPHYLLIFDLAANDIIPATSYANIIFKQICINHSVLTCFLAS